MYWPDSGVTDRQKHAFTFRRGKACKSKQSIIRAQPDGCLRLEQNTYDQRGHKRKQTGGEWIALPNASSWPQDFLPYCISPTKKSAVLGGFALACQPRPLEFESWPPAPDGRGQTGTRRCVPAGPRPASIQRQRTSRWRTGTCQRVPHISARICLRQPLLVLSLTGIALSSGA